MTANQHYIKEQWERAIANCPNVPSYTREGLENYLFERIPVGHFLSAVLDNDLFEAVGRADDQNLEALPEIVRVIYNGFPMEARNRQKWLGY